MKIVSFEYFFKGMSKLNKVYTGLEH